MDDLISKTDSHSDYLNVSSEDIEKYAKNLSEFNELKILEEQFSSTSNDLNEAKTQLSSVEKEIKAIQEEKAKKEKRSVELYSKGKKYEDSGEFEKALDAFLEILEIFPEHMRATHHIQKIEKHLKEKENQIREQEVIARKKAEEANQFFESGKRFYRAGNYEKALDEFNSALNVGGKNPDIIEYIEKCEQRIEEIEDALNKAKNENDQKKKSVNEYSVLAHSYLRKEEYERGIELLEKALIIMPDNVDVQESLRQAENKFNEYKEDLRRKKAEAEAKNIEIQRINLDAVQFIRNHEYQKAISKFEEILNIDPSKSDILEEIKTLQLKIDSLKLERQKKEEEAVKKQTEYSVLAHSHFRKEEYEKGIELLEKALIIMPDNVDVQESLRQAEKKFNEYKDNLRRKKAETEAKNSEIQRINLEAVQCINNHEYQKAISKFEEILSIDPSQSDILEEIKTLQLKIDSLKLERQKKEEEKVKKRNEEAAFLKENYAMGVQAFIKNEIETSSELFLKVVSLNPDFEEVKSYMHKIEEILFEKNKKDKEKYDLILQHEYGLKKIKYEEEKQQKEEVRELFEEGLRLFTENKLKQALINFEKTFSIDPNHTAAFREIEKTRDILNEKTKTEEILKKQKLEEEKEKELLNRKIKILNEDANDFLTHGYYQKALEYFEQILKLDPGNSHAKAGIFKSSNEIKSEEEKQKIITDEEHKKKEIQNNYFEGRLNYEEGNYKAAIEKWEYVLSIDSYNERVKKDILNAKSKIREIHFCEEAKFRVMNILKDEESKFNELKNKINNGLFLSSQNRYSEALKVWKEFYPGMKKQDVDNG